MNYNLFYIALASLFISNSYIVAQNASLKKMRTLFATEKHGVMQIKIDTVKFKNTLRKELFAENSSIFLSQVEVCKKKTIGEKSEEFYFVRLCDKTGEHTICRLLQKRGKSLYLIDDPSLHDVLSLTYITCSGENKCEPNLYVLENKRNWICGTDPKCAAPGSKLECIFSKTVLLPD